MPVFQFPDEVNEKAARTVAAMVATVAAVAVIAGLPEVAPLLCLGFVTRVLTGPRFSPFALLATRVVAPRLGPPRLVPGPPKRFAQGIGAAVTLAASVAVALGSDAVALVLLAGLFVAATAEAALGFCAGCWLFGRLGRAGLLPASVCVQCADISSRLAGRTFASDPQPPGR